jgi:hypothetical protein
MDILDISCRRPHLQVMQFRCRQPTGNRHNANSLHLPAIELTVQTIESEIELTQNYLLVSFFAVEHLLGNASLAVVSLFSRDLHA